MTTLSAAAVAPCGAPIDLCPPSASISQSPPRPQWKRFGFARLGSYLLHHWQGRLALRFSFWLNSVLLSFLMPRLLEGVADALPFSRWPRVACSAVIGLWLLVLAIALWQWVGLWRSADRYAGPILWANLAKGFVLVGALSAVQVLHTQALPQVSEFWRLAKGQDRLANYRVAVSPDERVLEIDGPMGFGLSQTIEHALDAHPRIRQVRLNSIGGRIGEAKRLAAVITERGLSTSSTTHCLSACVIAFAAGTERVMAPTARFGFHQPAFPGWSETELNAEIAQERQDFLARGIAAGFVNQALATPSTALWQASSQELLAAGFVTRIEEGG